MKNTLAAAVAILVTACSSKAPLNTTAVDQKIYDEYMPECTFKDQVSPAPKWICGFPMSEYPISDVGYSRSGLEEEAKADAVAKLAARVKTTVETEMKKTAATTGSSYESSYSSVSVQRVREALMNTRVLLRITDPSTGGIHVLVVADLGAYEETMRKSKMTNSQ